MPTFRVVRPDIHQHADAPHVFGLLCARSERPRRGGTADKCDEFPSPHGFAPAKDYIGYEESITFFD
jgi:hypothetical protein